MTSLLRLLVGFGIAAVVAELSLRALPVSTGYSFMRVSAQEPILRGTPHALYVYSRSWNFRLRNSGRLNNYGFRSSYDYRPDPAALLVLGNSFVEADAVSPPQNMTETLGRLLARPAYAIGVDGFALVDYLVAARWGAAEFWRRSIREEHVFLVLLTTGDLDHSCSPRKGEHFLTRRDGRMSIELVPRATPSRLKNWINDSMLFRYVFDNLRLTSNWERDQAGGRPGGADRVEGAVRPDAVDSPHAPVGEACNSPEFRAEATRFLLGSFRELETATRAHVIFVVAPGYREDQHYAPGATRDVDAFARQAQSQGFQIVRMDVPFAAALRAGLRLDFVPVDGHWNATGNAIAARAIAAALRGGSRLESPVTTASREPR